MKVLYGGCLFFVFFLLSSASVVAADEGKSLYVSKCLMCHGDKGHGDGRVGKALKATNIARALARRGVDEAQLLAGVMKGRGAMPSWEGVLSEAQVKTIFEYIREIQ